MYSDNVSNVAYSINKLKSNGSFAINKLSTERASQFNQDLKNKVSYEWKNIYRSLI
jgi:hypothetical protein